MDSSPYERENYQFSSDENDVFDENLDLFDDQQFGAFEDGIGFSKIDDENELEDGDDSLIDDEEDTSYDDSDQMELEMEDYDSLDD